jgi:hypothetical protein
VPELGGALPKAIVFLKQRFFEDDSVFGFGASAMLGRSPLQGFDEIGRKVPDK